VAECIKRGIFSTIQLRKRFVDDDGILGTKEKKLYQKAIDTFNLAIEIKADYVEAYIQRGVSQGEIGYFEKALNSFDEANIRQVQSIDSYVNRGYLLHGVNRLKEAISSYDRALIIDENHIISHFNKSITLLLNGDLERGFEEYEWRLKMYNQPNHIRYKRTFDQPQWLGDKNLKGCTIFIYHEQGLGDALQFCRYV
jgi:tetratricopeptide (TPR) repeat protein